MSFFATKAISSVNLQAQYEPDPRMFVERACATRSMPSKARSFPSSPTRLARRVFSKQVGEVDNFAGGGIVAARQQDINPREAEAMPRRSDTRFKRLARIEQDTSTLAKRTTAASY